MKIERFELNSKIDFVRGEHRKIKRFRLKPEINLSKIPKTQHMTYVHKKATRGFSVKLKRSISLEITFPDDISEWNDFDFVLVLDFITGQSYTPFYDYLNGNIEIFPFLLEIITEYNKKMKSLPYLDEIVE